MDRREFISAVSMGLLAMPLAAWAQQARVVRIGWLAPSLDRMPSTRFETAKALGLTIPPSLLGRADQIIR